MNDINQKRSIKALKDIKDADVVFYFLNAEGVVLGKSELDSLNKISKRNENVIVVLNKIEGIEKDDVIAISTKTGEGIEQFEKALLEMRKSQAY